MWNLEGRLPQRMYDDDDHFPHGDLVAFAIAHGPAFAVLFAAPYEPVILVDGQAVPLRRHSREFLFIRRWIFRHLPALYRALEVNRVLEGRIFQNQFIATDVFDRTGERFLGRHEVRRLLDDAGVVFPVFFEIRSTGTPTSVRHQLKNHNLVGIRVEIREELHDEIVSRRMMQT